MKLVVFKNICRRFGIGFRFFNPELIFWTGAMIYLYCINPYVLGHFDFCLWSRLGIDFCPGCGLGRAIALLLDGDIIGSFDHHPLGIPATIFILFRIYRLTLFTAKQINSDTGGPNGQRFSTSA